MRIRIVFFVNSDVKEIVETILEYSGQHIERLVGMSIPGVTSIEITVLQGV